MCKPLTDANEVGQAVPVEAKSEELVAYETLDEGRIARIWLNRPEAHNAQSRGLLVQLDEAFFAPRPTTQSGW